MSSGWEAAVGGGAALRQKHQPDCRQWATGRQRALMDNGVAADSCGAAFVSGSYWRWCLFF